MSTAIWQMGPTYKMRQRSDLSALVDAVRSRKRQLLFLNS